MSKTKKDKKRVLLTGSSGFIGSHTLEYLLEKTNWDFVLINSWKHKGTPERIERFLNKSNKHRVTNITHDLISPLTEITKKRIGKDIDFIINIASESHVDRSIEDPVTFIQNNVNLVLNLLEFAREVKPSHFIQISTDEVYGSAPDGVRFKEWSKIVPSNPYSASKAAQEAICYSYWRTFGVPVVITNTVNNFGEMQDEEKYLAKLIKMIDKDKRVTVHGSEDFIGSRFYMYVKNHSDAILFLLGKEPTLYEDSGEEIHPDRYNIYSDDELDNLDIAKLIAKLMDKELKYELIDYHKDRPGHDRRYGLDTSKIKEAGWKMPFSLEESLKKYIKYEIKNNENKN